MKQLRKTEARNGVWKKVMESVVELWGGREKGEERRLGGQQAEGVESCGGLVISGDKGGVRYAEGLENMRVGGCGWGVDGEAACRGAGAWPT